MGHGMPMTDPFIRFMRKVQVTDSGCWLWTGAISDNGYGRFKNSTEQYAHRLSYKLFKGPIPPGLCVLHTCDNRACVRPAHLWIGTALDNARDCIAKSRARRTPPRWSELMRTTRHHWQKLNREDIPEIKRRIAQGDLQREIAKDYGVATNTIGGIAQGRRWNHV